MALFFFEHPIFRTFYHCFIVGCVAGKTGFSLQCKLTYLYWRTYWTYRNTLLMLILYDTILYEFTNLCSITNWLMYMTLSKYFYFHIIIIPINGNKIYCYEKSRKFLFFIKIRFNIPKKSYQSVECICLCNIHINLMSPTSNVDVRGRPQMVSFDRTRVWIYSFF